MGAETFHVDGEADEQTDMMKPLRLKMRNFFGFHISVSKYSDLQSFYTVSLGGSLGYLIMECNFTFS